MNERYLKINEVAEILGVTPLTLRNWDKRGQLVAYRNPLNNYRMYRYSDVADLLAEIKKSKAAAPISKLRVRFEDDDTAA